MCDIDAKIRPKSVPLMFTNVPECMSHAYQNLCSASWDRRSPWLKKGARAQIFCAEALTGTNITARNRDDRGSSGFGAQGWGTVFLLLFYQTAKSAHVPGCEKSGVGSAPPLFG